MEPASTESIQITPATSVPAVTEAYQKAHKSYVLAAALLGSWQLIGITLDTKEKWGIELKSPSAVPLVLVALIIYFGYKTTIEWWQCDDARRNNRAALLDFRVAHAIAFIALSISVVQLALQRQIFDIVAAHVPPPLKEDGFSCYMCGLFLGWKGREYVRLYKRRRDNTTRTLLLAAGKTLVPIIILGLLAYRARPMSGFEWLLVYVGCTMLGVIVGIFYGRTQDRISAQKELLSAQK